MPDWSRQLAMDVERQARVMSSRISELRDGDPVHASYRVTDTHIGHGRNGRAYLRLQLSDETNVVQAMMWDVADPEEITVKAGDWITVEGRVQVYRESLQIVVRRIEGCPPAIGAQGLQRTSGLPTATRQSVQPHEISGRVLPKPRQPSRSPEERLIYAIEQCLSCGRPAKVNFSIPRHEIITKALHRFVYDPAYTGTALPIVFRDASEPPPFPFGCLDGAATHQVPSNRVIYAGLMSMRHPELDYLVDLYVTRNQELAKEAAMADEERLAFERTMSLLSAPELDEGGEIRVLHTGLEPMIVGFYRAVVHVLHDRATRNLAIRSMFYRDPGSESDTALTPRSPGALLENYEESLLWW